MQANTNGRTGRCAVDAILVVPFFQSLEFSCTGRFPSDKAAKSGIPAKKVNFIWELFTFAGRGMEKREPVYGFVFSETSVLCWFRGKPKRQHAYFGAIVFLGGPCFSGCPVFLGRLLLALNWWLGGFDSWFLWWVERTGLTRPQVGEAVNEAPPATDLDARNQEKVGEVF